MAEDNKKIYLLDAFALIFRAYFAFIKRPLINSKGFNTSAMTGFMNTLLEIIQKEKPTHLAVCFDLAGPTTRAIEYDFYKANRDETPADIISNIGPIKEILRGMHIPIIELEGYEADDLIGTMAKQAESQGFQVYMVTPDKDFGQLVSENIFMYKPKSGFSPQQTLGVKEILAKWDIERIDQVIDMLGLMGDAVDNIPGILGVGQKTAQKFIKEYGSVEGLLANTDQVKGKMREKVEAGKENAIISKMLATIILDAPIEFNEEALILSEPDAEKLGPLFDEYEFRTLGKRILGELYNFGTSAAAGDQMDLFASAPSEATPAHETLLKTLENAPHDYKLVESAADRKGLIEKLSKAELVCFDTETTGLDPIRQDIVQIAGIMLVDGVEKEEFDLKGVPIRIFVMGSK